MEREEKGKTAGGSEGRVIKRKGLKNHGIHIEAYLPNKKNECRTEEN